MPFRASFYEHFGYGNAEKRVEWTVPLPILPRGDFSGYRFYEDADLPAIRAARQREYEAGQCDIESTAAAFEYWMRLWPEGMVVVDQSGAGACSGYIYFTEDRTTPAATVVVQDWCADGPDAIGRMLCFLGSLKDQYSQVRITLPGDLPLNRLLRESQIPHRQVDHPVAQARPFTRMQIRILDHRATLEAMKLPVDVSGRINVDVGECEKTVSRLSMDIDRGRITVRPGSSDADVQCSDVLWASMISGDLPASIARGHGLIRCNNPAKLPLLDAFAAGPQPYCQEYF
jgi:predicted acetyltransferase